MANGQSSQSTKAFVCTPTYQPVRISAAAADESRSVGMV
jgi:hypothetical protein